MKTKELRKIEEQRCWKEREERGRQGEGEKEGEGKGGVGEREKKISFLTSGC